jgi:hypothetical protein
MTRSACAVPSTFQPSHRTLLTPLNATAEPGGALFPDAIVVPTARPATQPRSGLAFAARLASATARPLVIVVSKDAATRAALDALEQAVAGAGASPPLALVLHLNSTPTTKTRFDVDDLDISRAYSRGGCTDGGRVPANDVGRKRNLLLLLARSMRWRTVLFLDDDVFVAGPSKPAHRPTLDLGTLAAATSAVTSGRHAAVGWALRDFDDNSVLCRIRSLLGDHQDQFIGGGALLVDVEADLPFFPAIYNEDWLFLLRLLTSGHRHPVLDGGHVHQDEYDPFPAARAASEEVGDLIGEGLLSLVQSGGRDALHHTSDEFWRRAVRARRAMLEDLRRRVDAAGDVDWGEMPKALDAVAAIHERLMLEEASWVAQIQTFVQMWHADLGRWRRRLYRDAPPRPRAFLDGPEFVPERMRVIGGSSVDGFVDAHAR